MIKSRLIQALKKVDEICFEEKLVAKKIELKVIGGFALLLNGVRENSEVYTDIDYIGPTLSREVQKVVDRVGLEFNFGVQWINNDSLLEGSSLGELELVTGPLSFSSKLDLKCFSVSALNNEHILRLKMIAIDTTYMTLRRGEIFSREKDFDDVKQLMKILGLDLSSLRALTSEYVLEPKVYSLVRKYLLGESIYETI